LDHHVAFFLQDTTERFITLSSSCANPFAPQKGMASLTDLQGTQERDQILSFLRSESDIEALLVEIDEVPQ